MSLARYLREKLSLTGTKIMCGQAGCGACVVTAYVPKSNSEKGYEAISINSVRVFEILDNGHSTQLKKILNIKIFLISNAERMSLQNIDF